MASTPTSSFHMKPLKERNLYRLLMGPGPCNPPASAREASSLPLLGHLDPTFGEIMDELQIGLRHLFGTTNEVCFAASGTGSSGMELLATNLVEPGDIVVVGVNGVFGGRIVEMCEKLQAKVYPIKVEFGEGISLESIQQTIQQAGGKVDIVWVVHAETSTGYRMPKLKEMADLTHQHGGIFLIDTVTGLGGIEVKIDEWGIDGAFSGTQKCIGVTPSLSPLTIGPRAIEKFQRRKAVVPSWYFDLGKLLGYWHKKEGKRTYHHTAPISSIYSLHEGVRLLLEETLLVVQERYRRASAELSSALSERGFTYVVKEEENRLPQLHCVYPPANVDEMKLRKNLLAENIEIGAGLGSLAGRAVRIGVMGDNANIKTIHQFLQVLDKVLPNSQK